MKKMSVLVAVLSIFSVVLPSSAQVELGVIGGLNLGN